MSGFSGHLLPPVGAVGGWGVLPPAKREGPLVEAHPRATGGWLLRPQGPLNRVDNERRVFENIFPSCALPLQAQVSMVKGRNSREYFHPFLLNLPGLERVHYRGFFLKPWTVTKDDLSPRMNSRFSAVVFLPNAPKTERANYRRFCAKPLFSPEAQTGPPHSLSSFKSPNSRSSLLPSLSKSPELGRAN